MTQRFRPGDYLVVDDESGLVGWASEMRIRWDGAFVRPKGWETRNPQEFVRALRDPKGLKDVRPQVLATAASTDVPPFVGQTTVPTPYGPATHLFGGGPAAGSGGPPPFVQTYGIGTMKIEATDASVFQVR